MAARAVRIAREARIAMIAKRFMSKLHRAGSGKLKVCNHFHHKQLTIGERRNGPGITDE
jgi:hypothetical protein